MAAGKPPHSDTAGDSYLPNFCSGQMVLAVVLIAELVAIILALLRYTDAQAFWLTLARTSLFLLWAGLGCSAALCLARPWLARWTARHATVLAIALLVGTTALVSLMALFLGHSFDGGAARSPLLPQDNVGFVLRNVVVSAIISALVLRYFYVAHQWRRNVELEARARIGALQARIRPHFLFNSMNTIAMLTRSDPLRAEQAVEDLADLFRSSLADASVKVRLKEELEMTRLYQRVEQLRLGDRLTVVWDVERLPMRALVPGLCIQPLLENAIYHGIENLPQGGVVTITGENHGHAFEIEMRNPVPPDGPRRHSSGNKIALENIRQRLDLAYDKPAKVTNVVENGQYRVTLWIPMVESAR